MENRLQSSLAPMRIIGNAVWPDQRASRDSSTKPWLLSSITLCQRTLIIY